MDVLTPATFKNMLNDPDNPNNSKSSTQQKRSKRNSMAIDPAEKKIEVKLNCQKRLSAFFGKQQPKSPLTCENPEEWDEEFKKALDFSGEKTGPIPSDLSVNLLFLNLYLSSLSLSLKKDFY